MKKNKKEMRLFKMAREFKEFALRGNVMDLAIGVIVGGAFGQITGSLVNDILLPAIGLLIGGMDFSSLNFSIPSSIEGKPPVTINTGTFIGVIVNFIIIAFFTFLLVKGMNRLRRAPEPESAPTPPSPPAQEVLLAEIRDALLAIRDQNK